MKNNVILFITESYHEIYVLRRISRYFVCPLLCFITKTKLIISRVCRTFLTISKIRKQTWVMYRFSQWLKSRKCKFNRIRNEKHFFILIFSRLCCQCGVPITPNPANMCVACIRTQVDITADIPKQVVIYFCRFCER